MLTYLEELIFLNETYRDSNQTLNELLSAHFTNHFFIQSIHYLFSNTNTFIVTKQTKLFTNITSLNRSIYLRPRRRLPKMTATFRLRMAMLVRCQEYCQTLGLICGLLILCVNKFLRVEKHKLL